MPSADHFRHELTLQLARAQKRGAEHVQVNAGELHRAVGDYPGPNHRMPSLCEVMHSEMIEGDIVVESPPEGKGAGLTIRYILPRRS